MDMSGGRRFGSGVMSFVGRHPVACYLVMAFAIFWAAWTPVLLWRAAAPVQRRGCDPGLGAAGFPCDRGYGRPSRGP